MFAPNTLTQQPASDSILRRFVARYPVSTYLIMAFTFAWAILIPVLLSKQGFGVLPIDLPVTLFQFLASIVGLTIPAFLVAAATGGTASVQALLRQSLRWRVGIQWYLIALLVTFVAVLAIALPFVGLVPLQMLASKWQLLVTLFVPGVLVPFLTTNLPEEIGWTSLQARLQDRHGPVLATIIVTPFFSLFHLPAYFVAGWIGDEATALSQFPTVLLTTGVIAVLGIFFRLVALWLYNGTGGSLLLVALFHSAYNMTNQRQIISELVPGSDASLMATLAIIVVGVLVTACTRGRLAYKPAASYDGKLSDDLGHGQ